MPGIEVRIAALETTFTGAPGRVPGTSLTRQLTPDGVRWVLSLGSMGEPFKDMFAGETIDAAVSAAESFLVNAHKKSARNHGAYVEVPDARAAE